MASASRIFPLIFEPRSLVRNGRLVSGTTPGRLSTAINHGLVFRRKNVFTKCIDLGNLYAATTGTHNPWRVYFRTGEGESGNLNLVFDHLLMPSGAGNAGQVSWTVAEVGGSSATTFSIFDARSGSAIPSNIARRKLVYQVSPDTEYTLTCNASGGAKPFACTIYEQHGSTFDLASVSGGGVDTNAYGIGTPIVDADEGALTTAMHELYRHNGAHLLSWCTDWDPANGGDKPTRTTASYANAFDQSQTTVSSTSTGFVIRANDHHPYHNSATGGVSVKIAAFGKDNGGANLGGVRLLDSSGTIATITGFSTGGDWQTATASIDGSTTHKIDAHIKGDGVSSFELHALCMWTYIT